MLVTPADVEAAAARIGTYVRTTPVVEVAAGELGLPAPVTLKLELLQHTGSFKPRGAFHRVLRADVPPAGLVAASGGNHGAAVAHVAARLGHRAEVFVPSTSPAMKRDRIAALGADVRVVDGYYDDAQAAANERAGETGALLVHPYDHVDVVAGQGTMGRELERQAGPLDTVVVATGGGGFIGGQAAWFAGRVRVVSVEPATSRCLHAALEAGRPVPVEVRGLAADSLGAAQLGDVRVGVGAPLRRPCRARRRRGDPGRATGDLGRPAPRRRARRCRRPRRGAHGRLRARAGSNASRWSSAAPTATRPR